MTLSGTLRMMSGLPFTILNTSTDPDRNGILFDPLPAGDYEGTGANAIKVKNDGGRNGAYGPGFIQFDTRLGWRLRLRAEQHAGPVARSDQPHQPVELPQPDRREHPERRGPAADQLPAADPAVGRRPAAPGADRPAVRLLASPAIACRHLQRRPAGDAPRGPSHSVSRPRPTAGTALRLGAPNVPCRRATSASSAGRPRWRQRLDPLRATVTKPSVRRQI